jgi:hypothetical protein
MSRLWMALGALVLLGGQAQAQSSPWQAEERTTAGWVFTPGTALGGFWDSGVQRDSNPVVETLVHKWVGVANPRAELDFNGRRTHFNVGYSGSFEKNFSEGLHWEHRGRLSVRRTLSPRLSLSGNASYSAVPTTDRLLMTQGVVPYVDANSQWLNAGGGFTFRGGRRTMIYGDYRFEQVNVDRTLSAAFDLLRDGYSHAPSLGFTQDFTSRLSLGAQADYRREVVGIVEGFDELYDIRTINATFTYRWSQAMSISGSGGASQVESLDIGESTTSPTFSGSFTRRMRTVTLGARYSRAFEQVFGFGTLAATDTISGDALMPLADRLYYLEVGAAFNRTAPIPELGIGFDMSTLWTNVAVGRQLAPRLRAEAFVSVAIQGAAANALDGSNRTRLGIQIVTSKPLRIQ